MIVWNNNNPHGVVRGPRQWHQHLIRLFVTFMDSQFSVCHLQPRFFSYISYISADRWFSNWTIDQHLLEERWRKNVFALERVSQFIWRWHLQLHNQVCLQNLTQEWTKIGLFINERGVFTLVDTLFPQLFTPLMFINSFVPWPHR